MKLKRVLCIFFSPTHTTRQTARAIARGTGLPAVECDLTLPTARAARLPLVEEGDIVILGAPVYGGNAPAPFFEFVHTLEGKGAPAVVFAQYGNRHYDAAVRQLAAAATRAGLVPVAAGAFVGEHSVNSAVAQGRPDETDLAQAEAFGAAVLQKCTGEGLPAVLEAERIPFRQPDVILLKRHRGKIQAMGPTGPTVNRERCTACGCCTVVCPTGCIRCEEGKTEVNGAACMLCCACVRSCPAGALNFDSPFFEEFAADCKASFGAPAAPNITVL